MSSPEASQRLPSTLTDDLLKSLYRGQDHSVLYRTMIPWQTARPYLKLGVLVPQVRDFLIEESDHFLSNLRVDLVLDLVHRYRRRWGRRALIEGIRLGANGVIGYPNAEVNLCDVNTLPNLSPLPMPDNTNNIITLM